MSDTTGGTHSQQNLYTVEAAQISGITTSEFDQIDSTHGLELGLTQVVAYAVHFAALALQSNRNPGADIGRAAIKIEQKFLEHITGTLGVSSRFSSIISTMLNEALHPPAGTNPGNHAYQVVEKLKHQASTALEGLTFTTVTPQDINMDQAIGFRITLANATYRLSGCAEVLPAIEINPASKFFKVHPPAPVAEGLPVATVLGQSVTAVEGQFMELMEVLDNEIFEGKIIPNPYGPRSRFIAGNTVRIIPETAWFMEMTGSVFMIPPTLAFQIMQRNML